MNTNRGGRPAVLPKNVGLLFFNEHPEHFFPATQIDVVWFPKGAGGDRFDEKTFKGPLDRIAKDARHYIQSTYLKQTVIKHDDRAEADRFWNFPYAAIEEAVVNAVYHRSYEIREPIEVRITPEELVVLSFPGPDRSIKMEDLRRGQGISRRYRNRRIGEFLKELNLTEGRSTGISKILKAMKTNGSPLPEFETDGTRTYFLTRLPVHHETQTSELPGKSSEKSSEKIVHFLQQDGNLSAVQLAEKIGISSRAIEKHLAKLQKTGKLRRIGPDKGGYWHVKKEDK